MRTSGFSPKYEDKSGGEFNFTQKRCLHIFDENQLFTRYTKLTKTKKKTTWTTFYLQ